MVEITQEQAKAKLDSLRQNETPRSLITSEKRDGKPLTTWKGLPRAYLTGIFERFAKLYGNVWTSQIPTQDELEGKMQAWAIELKGLSPQEIKDGLGKLGPMPPSCPEFKAMCKRYTSQAQKPYEKALPKPPPNIHKGKAALSAIKHTLRKGTKEDPEYVPPERIPADEAAFERGDDYEKRKAKGFIGDDGHIIP